MDNKLQELTKKLYSEGVERAKIEADDILKKAKIEADETIQKAKKEAEAILANAKKDSEKLSQKTNSELKMAGDQAITTIKQQISSVLSSTAVSAGVKESLKDNEFLKELIKGMVSKWDLNTKSVDLNVVLGAGMKGEFEKFLKAQAADIFTKGVELKFEDRMDGGFKIGPKDNTFLVSFTDKDFISFFQSFLKSKTKEILFGGEK